MMRMVICVLVMLGSIARADIPDPGVEACQGKGIGDACESGACLRTTCSRTRPGPDGVASTTTWDCVMCTAGVAAPGDNLRLGIGIGVALLVVGGGIWLARRKMKAAA